MNRLRLEAADVIDADGVPGGQTRVVGVASLEGLVAEPSACSDRVVVVGVVVCEIDAVSLGLASHLDETVDAGAKGATFAVR